ncbi:MAG: TatD family hydrolase [Rhodobacteraceae bacterium]|nr:TatD family hydrolase [Paracoccaceae bacterium]
MLVDSHCHLDFPDFAEELPEVVARAQAAGVGRMVTICTRPRQVDNVRAIAERFEPVYFAAGLHPLNAHEEPHPSVEDLVGWSAHSKMVGIGEAGLDYHYQRETEATQKQSFAVQIEAARRTGLPLIIHSRDADADMAEILTREHAAGPFSCVMHCFSSGAALAETALSLGFYLSMSGVVTFKKAQELRDIFAAAPLERVLVETDAPYLAPPPHRGKRNEPAYVAKTAAVGADVFGMSPEAFAEATTENFHRLFAKVPRVAADAA